VDPVSVVGAAEPTASLRHANVDLVASAPIFSADDLVGLLSIGIAADDSGSSQTRQARLLAAAIDYAGVLGAVAGSAIAGRREMAAAEARLEQILVARAFHTVFQPIVEFEGLVAVGYEALTRFDDGVPPDVRFAEAAQAEIAAAFELAAIQMAIEQSAAIPAEAFVSVNVSPRTVIDYVDDLRTILGSTDRQLVVELTEHVMIDDYHELRAADTLQPVRTVRLDYSAASRPAPKSCTRSAVPGTASRGHRGSRQDTITTSWGSGRHLRVPGTRDNPREPDRLPPCRAVGRSRRADPGRHRRA
jgi:predicted signal transduction protein with EAL and GGDEF domain